jgi:hypothetical protein
MQPFTKKTAYTLAIALAGFLICHYLYQSYHGIGWLVLRSLTFLLLYLSGVIYLSLSPDVKPVWNTVKERLGFRSLT